MVKVHAHHIDEETNNENHKASQTSIITSVDVI